jgi:hypothetical protein
MSDQQQPYSVQQQPPPSASERRDMGRLICEAKLTDGPCFAFALPHRRVCLDHQDHALRQHLGKALEALTDEFNQGTSGPSGLRAQAIAHVRYALAMLRVSDV